VPSAVAVIPWNPKRQKNRSCLPPTWPADELGKHSSIERFFTRAFRLFGIFRLPRPPLCGWSAEASWIGLGGLGNSYLVQTGTFGQESYVANNGWVDTYQAWVENVGGINSPPRFLFYVHCGDHMYVKVWGGHCMYIMRISDGLNSGNQCYGNNARTTSAEAIVERQSTDKLLGNFGTQTFHGVGITDNGAYLGMNQVPHDYTNMWSCWGLECHNPYQIASVGSIQNDPGDVPYDKYTITWHDFS